MHSAFLQTKTPMLKVSLEKRTKQMFDETCCIRMHI